MTIATIAGIFRYPVKGLSAEAMNSATLAPGQGLQSDRAWAIEAGTGKFDSIAPKYLPKSNFLMLMRDERLAALETEFDHESGVLILRRDGKQVARGNLREKIGRQLIEQFFAAYLPKASRGAPKVVQSEDWSFSDIPVKQVSIINLASVRDIERVAGKPVDPARFRGNILIDGTEPWAEHDWLDKTLEINGKAMMEIRTRTTRCAAVNVNLQTAKRDMTLPRLLADAFGHQDCGLYASVVANGEIAIGDAITIVD